MTQAKSRLVIVVGPSNVAPVEGQAQRAGEVNYVLPTVLEILNRGQSANTETRFYTARGWNESMDGIGGKGDLLPTTKAEYAKTTPVNRTVLWDLISATGMDAASGKRKFDEVQVVGLGNSTLDTVASLVDNLKDRARKVEGSYVTHQVDNDADLNKIIDNGITVFTTKTAAEVAGLPLAAGLEDGRKLKHVKLDAVPNPYSPALVNADVQIFATTEMKKTFAQLPTVMGQVPDPKAEMLIGIATATGARILDMADNTKFAVAVVNAGFPVDGKHVPYMAHEARNHGAALGSGVKPGTPLVLVEGGPRNKTDREQHGQDTMQEYARGYLKTNPSAVVYLEPFVPGAAYDATKVAVKLAQHENCTAFISSAEGRGIVDAVVSLVDNTKTTLGMFSFGAIQADPKRIDTLNADNAGGMALLWVESHDGSLRVQKSTKGTPIPQRDPVVQIIDTLGLAKPAAAPKPEQTRTPEALKS